MTNSETAPLISVIIVTWNSAAYLGRCLDCLEAQTRQDFEVILVDNASEDETLKVVEERESKRRLQIKKLAENRGFAAANNAGSTLARGTWLALLNPDAFPEPDWLDSLIRATKQYPEFAFFASRQLQANEPDRLDGAGDAYHVSGLAWRRFTGGPAARLALEPREVFSPCAAAALYLKEAFLKAGGFDEDFFAYHEDVDLGFRLRLQGFRCMYIPQAVVRHIGSASTGRVSPFVIYHGHRNLVWTYFKDMPGLLFWFYLPLHTLMNLFFLLSFTFQGQARAIWRAKWDGLLRLGLMLRKRQEVQGQRRVKTGDLVQQMERSWLAPLQERGQRARFQEES